MRLKQTVAAMRSKRAAARLQAQAEKAGLSNLLILLRDQLDHAVKHDIRNGEYDLIGQADWHGMARRFHLPGHDQDLSLKVRVLQHVAINYAHLI